LSLDGEIVVRVLRKQAAVFQKPSMDPRGATEPNARERSELRSRDSETASEQRPQRPQKR
jgi:hypothetical protein